MNYTATRIAAQRYMSKNFGRAYLTRWEYENRPTDLPALPAGTEWRFGPQGGEYTIPPQGWSVEPTNELYRQAVGERV